MADAPNPDGESSGEQHVLAVVFAKATRADEALLTLVHLGQEGAIEIADAVVVAKTADGRTHVRQTVDPTPGRAAMGGAWLGTLVGLLFGGPLGGAVAGAAGAALYAKLVDIGLDDGWVKQMAEWLDPGTSALLLLLNDDGVRAEVIEELQRFDGQLVTTTFPDSVRRALEEGLTTEA